jgi:hypothetical protein
MRRRKMITRHILTLVLLSLFIAMAFPPNPGHASSGVDLGGNPLTLPANTPVKLVFLEELYSQRNLVGDEIIFAVAEDVVVMDRTYLCAGTPVIGRVTAVKPAKSWGRQGTMDIEILSVAPIYSEPIALTFDIGAAGGSEKATSIGASAAGLLVLGPAAVFAGSTISGSGAVIEPGTEITALTAADGGIRNISADSMQELADEWLEARVIDALLNYSWDDTRTIQETFASIGHDVDESSVTIVEMSNYYYRASMQIKPDMAAEFEFRPFDEPHIGKFITLDPLNELAEIILKIME